MNVCKKCGELTADGEQDHNGRCPHCGGELEEIEDEMPVDRAAEDTPELIEGRALFVWFLDRLPPFDPAWPAEICQAWLECFIQLWRWGCRLMIVEKVSEE